MATMSRPAPLVPRSPLFPKLRRPRRRPAVPQATPSSAEPAPVPSACTRSAFPLAVTWFLLPALLLVLSVYFGWTR